MTKSDQTFGPVNCRTLEMNTVDNYTRPASVIRHRCDTILRKQAKATLQWCRTFLHLQYQSCQCSSMKRSQAKKYIFLYVLWFCGVLSSLAWTEWSQWSDCKASAAECISVRKRKCETFDYMDQANCDADGTEEEEEEVACTKNKCFEAAWGRWGPIQACTLYLGQGGSYNCSRIKGRPCMQGEAVVDYTLCG